jgi:D-alanyl-D-alanine carboxypeptidase
VDEAIRALVTKSANDVAVVLAERLGGTEKKFAVQMTERARELGLTSTVFKNASGLPNPEQTSTARDLAKLAEAIFFDHRDLYSYFATPEFVWRTRSYENHNRLLQTVDGVDGIKTGFTNASGFNLMASAERDGHRVLAIMLGGSSSRSRDEHVRDLLEAAFADISGTAIAGEDDVRVTLAFGRTSADASPLSDADLLALDQLRRFSELDAETTSGASAMDAEGDQLYP